MPEPTALLAATLLSTLSIAAAVLTAAVLGAVVAALLGRRDRGPSGSADGSVAGELRAIGAQIEQSLVEQRHQGETQRQLLTQKIEGVRETVETQGHEVGGLRNELRHEARRRDAELDEIRHQIAAIRTGEALPPAAVAALPAHVPDRAADAAAVDDAPAHDAAEAPAVGAEYAEESEDVDVMVDLMEDADVVDIEPLDLAEVEPPVDVEADPFGLDREEDPWGEGAHEGAAEAVGPFFFEDPDAAAPAPPVDDEPAAGGVAAEPSAFDIFTPISFDAPAPDAPPAPPTGATAWVARTDRDGGDAAIDAEGLVESTFAVPDEAPDVPEGAEDLTVISSIDEATQTILYGSGVLTLDDVARIGRGEAQRLGLEAGVSEHTIMNQWVFEAQAAVFNRFAQEAQA